MKCASQLFSEEDRKKVVSAIEQAEHKTSAELVTVVATVSGRYDRAEDIFGFLTAMLAVAAGWLTCSYFHPEAAWKLGAFFPVTGLLPVLVTMIGGFMAGSFLATRFPTLRLPFIPAREFEEEVGRAARAAFMSSSIRKTDGGTGILLYVSLFEHRVVVLPDDTINEKLPGQDWQEVCDVIVAGMKSNQPAQALESAIARCGEILGKPLPRQDEDVNELGNELILID